MKVTERFHLRNRDLPVNPAFGFNGMSEVIFFKNYSRELKFNGIGYGNETWQDTCYRVIEGVFSIQKNWYKINGIFWDESYWQGYAEAMFKSLAAMNWLPPGRGLFAMGSDVVYERGSMPLYNCFYKEVGDDWINSISLIMDCLMNGVGAGFCVKRTGIELKAPRATFKHTIPDTREGWFESLEMVLEAFTTLQGYPEFDYSIIRPAGAPIATFGGIASGPGPLKELHRQVEKLCYRFIEDTSYDEMTFKTDIVNLVGVCVVSGNVRRSAEIALGDADDEVFWNLKNYNLNPEREAWGWMSNNSIKLTESSHFENLDYLAQQNADGYDLGYLNMRNFPYGRLGKNDGVPYDEAIGINPCGEIPLYDGETCNVVETAPTCCATVEDWLWACEFAAFYASTIALLPTHRHEVNDIVVKNRRIGVSIMDFTSWIETSGTAKVTSALRRGYVRIRETNKELAKQAGVPESIRVTTIKPGGTVPKLPARVSGGSYPTFPYMIRRMNVGVHEPVHQRLLDAGYPNEPSVYTDDTTCFEFPVQMASAPAATDVSIWKQANNVVLLQREWADNAVSNTLYFNPETEVDELESVLSSIAPVTKSVSLLPHTPEGKFQQMPEQGITKEEYEKRVREIKKIDWAGYHGSDGQDEKYCEGDRCTV